MGFFSDLFGGSSSSSESTILESKIVNETIDDLECLVVYLKGTPYEQLFSSGGYVDEFSFNLGIDFQARDEKTDEPLLCKIPSLTNGSNPIFGVEYSLGSLSTHQYWPKWVEFCRIPADRLMYTPPYKNSKINLIMQIFIESDNRLIIRKEFPLNFSFDEPGYHDFDKDRLEIECRGIKLAAAIACSDGNLSRLEGNIIKKYAENVVEIQLDKYKDKTKKKINESIEDGLSYSNVSTTKVSSLCRYINNIEGYQSTKMEVLELCLDVMAADDIADDKELELIEKISNKIGIEYDEFVKVREKRMIGLKTMSNDDEKDISSMETTIGIKSSWSKSEKVKHCKKEFRKWNSRLGALNDKQKQENAQKILDMIGKLLEHYKNA